MMNEFGEQRKEEKWRKERRFLERDSFESLKKISWDEARREQSGNLSHLAGVIFFFFMIFDTSSEQKRKMLVHWGAPNDEKTEREREREQFRATG